MPKKIVFKKMKRFDLIENGKANHLFKLWLLNGNTVVLDNNWNPVMKSIIIK